MSILPQFGEPTTEGEAQELKRFLEQGAELSVETIDRFEAEPARLAVPETLVLSFPQTESLLSELEDNEERQVLLSLEFAQHAISPTFAIALYLNIPDADTSTAESDSLIGSIAFFCHTEERDGVVFCVSHGDSPFGFRIPFTNTLKRTGSERELTVTLVPFAGPEQEPEPQTLAVRSFIELVVSTVRQES
jgi:hypothetical protein